MEFSININSVQHTKKPSKAKNIIMIVSKNNNRNLTKKKTSLLRGKAAGDLLVWLPKLPDIRSQSNDIQENIVYIDAA